MAAGTKGGGAAKAAAGKGALASDGTKRAAADPFAIHGDKTAEEHFAVLHYQGSGYGDINAHLRGNPYGTEIDPASLAHIPHLDSLVGKIRTTRDITVLRGITAHPGFDPSQIKAGHVYEDKGFFSTTTKKSTASFFGGEGETAGAVFHISVPKGTAGIPVYRMAGHTLVGGSEREVLLGRGSSVKVTKVAKGKGKLYHIYGHLQ